MTAIAAKALSAQIASLGFGAADGLRYGSLGFPLAFCALPLYVLLPNLYAREFGIPLATLGAILLGSRLFDALTDPLLGQLSDRLYAKSFRAVFVSGALAAIFLGLGFWFIFFPPWHGQLHLLIGLGVLLVITYAAYSALAICHQSWGAMLGGDEAQRSRIVAWREGLGLAGVVLAAVIPSLLGLQAMLVLFLTSLALGWLAWTQSMKPDPHACKRPIGPSVKDHVGESVWHPWRTRAFRRLMGVFMLNGIASAVPATLVLFFVQDRLQASEAIQPVFLGLYFVCGALAMPLWLRLVRRLGLARSWLVGMLTSITVFLWALQLGTDDVVAFGVVCALSGIALGGDLVLPGAILAGIIADAGDDGQAEGIYFGWWNFATKLNLALAAGVALPLLAWFGYAPGARDAQSLQALSLAYCGLPCLLKAIAAISLYVLVIRPNPLRKPL